MDPITAFATIVGLLGVFKSERRASSDSEYREFMDWLAEKRHLELVQSIEANRSLGVALETLLQNSHDEVMAKLGGLDRSLLELASHIDGIQQIAHAIAPEVEISEQAFSILKQLADSGAEAFFELKTMSGSVYPLSDSSGQIEIAEPRFVEDDLEKLTSLGLLIQDFNSKGGRIFRITRACVNYAQSVCGNA